MKVVNRSFEDMATICLGLLIVYCVNKVLLFNTIVTACFFQLLLLNCYIKHSGYFGSFLTAYCITLIQGPLLSGPIVGLKGRAYMFQY
jgi:hypothetical protein